LPQGTAPKKEPNYCKEGGRSAIRGHKGGRGGFPGTMCSLGEGGGEEGGSKKKRTLEEWSRITKES